jgi:GNAT superfamily N-acetyltransferase
MKLLISTATSADSLAIASLRTSVAKHLTHQYGRGHWSSPVTEESVLRGIKTSLVLVARNDEDAGIISTLRLATKKPWAIDLTYFSVVGRAVYLHDMAVSPDIQRQGIGRRFLQEAVALVRAWPSDTIRLDAYDSDAGAGAFYAKCGFREVGRVIYRNIPLIYFEMLL